MEKINRYSIISALLGITIVAVLIIYLYSFPEQTPPTVKNHAQSLLNDSLWEFQYFQNGSLNYSLVVKDHLARTQQNIPIARSQFLRLITLLKRTIPQSIPLDTVIDLQRFGLDSAISQMSINGKLWILGARHPLGNGTYALYRDSLYLIPQSFFHQLPLKASDWIDYQLIGKEIDSIHSFYLIVQNQRHLFQKKSTGIWYYSNYRCSLSKIRDFFEIIYSFKIDLNLPANLTIPNLHSAESLIIDSDTLVYDHGTIRTTYQKFLAVAPQSFSKMFTLDESYWLDQTMSDFQSHQIERIRFDFYKSTCEWRRDSNLNWRDPAMPTAHIFDSVQNLISTWQNSQFPLVHLAEHDLKPIFKNHPILFLQFFTGERHFDYEIYSIQTEYLIRRTNDTYFQKLPPSLYWIIDAR